MWHVHVTRCKLCRLLLSVKYKTPKSWTQVLTLCIRTKACRIVFHTVLPEFNCLKINIKKSERFQRDIIWDPLFLIHFFYQLIHFIFSPHPPDPFVSLSTLLPPSTHFPSVGLPPSLLPPPPFSCLPRVTSHPPACVPPLVIIEIICWSQRWNPTRDVHIK